MESLKQIIKDLSRHEVYLLRNLLKQQVNGCLGKRIQLFDLIRKKENPSEIEAAMILYKDKPNSAFCHLKKRLKGDLLNFLFLNNFIENNSNDNCSGAKSVFYKSLLFSQIFSAKNIPHEVSLLQKSMEEIAGQHEFPLEKLLMLEETILQQNEIDTMEEAGKVVRFIDEQCVSYKQIFMAKFYCKKLYHAAIHSGQCEIDDIEKTLEVIYGLKRLSEDQNLLTAKFWYCFLHSIYNWIFISSTKALEKANEAIDVILENPEKFTGENLSNIKTHIAVLYLCNGDTTSAAKYINHSALLRSSGHVVYLEAVDVSIQLCFCKDNLKEAEKIIRQEILRHKKKDDGFEFSKWKYYQACIEFAKGNYKNSLCLLMDKQEYCKGKSPKFILGLKLLEQMNLIELGKYDLMEYKIGAFKQLLKRTKSKNLNRYKLICKQLDELTKTGYDFVAMIKKQKTDIVSLEMQFGKCKWEPFSYEMIRFEKWLLAKVHNLKVLSKK
jgi:hypothetical protein